MARYIILLTCFATLFAPTVGARSLWTEDSKMNFLVTDANASRVGDIVSIIIEEDHSAKDSADSAGERTHEMSGLLSLVFNNRFMNKVFGDAGDPPGFKFSSSNALDGSTAVDQSNTFNSRISATIVKVDPVGNYLVEARRTIRIGEERKTIVLSGKIRPRDIINNTVFSWQVADAEISYLGDGTYNDYNKPTIIQRLFNFLF